MSEVVANVRLKSVALPAEHGGWGFILEPILLGLMAAPSAAGGWIGLAALGVFLLHQPLRMVLKDRLKGKRYARTMWAERFTALYGLAALIGFGLALLNTQHPFWIPLVLAVPFALVQLRYEALNRGRELLPEIAGALALLWTVSVMTLAAGWPLLESVAVWAVLAARTVTSIGYVRARIRLEKGELIEMRPVMLVHLLALIGLAVLALLRLIPALALVAFLILFGRAAYGLSRYRKPARAKTIGFQEMAYGLLYVIVTAIGCRL